MSDAAHLVSPSAALAATYDELPYADTSFRAIHPDRLAVMATLHGLHAPPVDACRVLEIGCGIGGNVLPMAEALPNASFLGIDISPRQIDLGRAAATELGLPNIEFRVQNLLELAPADGKFDYILCHGVFSWVPPDVQDGILRVCSRHLRPLGLAVISYNALPGWRAQMAVRDVLRMGARGAAGAGLVQQVRQARAFLDATAKALAKPDSPYAQTLKAAAESLAGRDDYYVFHEYLCEWNLPVCFEEFLARAAAAGLAFVDQADLEHRSAPAAAPPVLADPLADPARREQALDILHNRLFRRDVLCLAGRQPSAQPQPAALRSLRLVGTAAPAAAKYRTADRSMQRFCVPGGPSLSTDFPPLKTALVLLSRARPRAMAFDDLAAAIAAELGHVDVNELAEAMLRCATNGVVDLHTYLPPLPATPGQRPAASAVARQVAATRNDVTNLRHHGVRLDAVPRAVLLLADGTRTAGEIASALQAQYDAGTLRGKGKPRPTPARTGRDVEEILQGLANMWLLKE
jgi:2-polyprenyl-3-methyl-5-hydroxy-6-metoxy-1,4-benzoquinol methylase/methyltransferase-like protein